MLRGARKKGTAEPNWCVLVCFALLSVPGDADGPTAPAQPVLTAEEEAELAALMEDD